MPGKIAPFVSLENISVSYVSITKYILHSMSHIPVTTELGLQLNNKPLHLPVDKEHSVSLSTLKSAFGPTAIGLKFQENHKVKVVVCRNNKLFPPKVTPYVVFVVIKETDNPQVDIPDSVIKTRLRNASKQQNTHNGISSSDTLFPEVSYQDIQDLDLNEYRTEYDLLGKYCQ